MHYNDRDRWLLTTELFTENNHSPPPLWHFPKTEMLTNLAGFAFPTTCQQCQPITTLVPPLLVTLPPPLLLSGNGPKDDNVIWAPGKFSFFIMFFAFYLIQLTYIFHFLLILIYNNETMPRQWQWPLTGPPKHHQPLPWATAHRVGTCATTRGHHQTK